MLLLTQIHTGSDCLRCVCCSNYPQICEITQLKSRKSARVHLVIFLALIDKYDINGPRFVPVHLRVST